MDHESNPRFPDHLGDSSGICTRLYMYKSDGSLQLMIHEDREQQFLHRRRNKGYMAECILVHSFMKAVQGVALALRIVRIGD